MAKKGNNSDNNLIYKIQAAADTEQIKTESKKAVSLSYDVISKIVRMRDSIQQAANKIAVDRLDSQKSSARREIEDAVRSGEEVIELSPEAGKQVISDVLASGGDIGKFNAEDYYLRGGGASKLSSVYDPIDIKKTLDLYKQTLPVTENLRASINLVNKELNNQLGVMRDVAESGSTQRLQEISDRVKELALIKQDLVAKREEIKLFEKTRKANEKNNEQLSKYEEALKSFNEKYRVTGIVGIYAFRRISRYGRELLSSLIELTKENQKLEDGFSSLEKKINTLNSRITDIKTNLGSAITSVLEPSLDVLNTTVGYVSTLTKAFNEMPKPIKIVLGLLTSAVIILPSLISLTMLLRYYMSKVVETTLKQAAATSMVAKFMYNYRKQIVSTMSYIALFLVFGLALYNLFKKTSEESEKSRKNLGLASFDDVNVLTKSSTSEIEEITEKTKKLYKVISGIVAGVSLLIISLKTVKTLGNLDSYMKIFKSPTLIAGVLAIAAAIAGIVVFVKKLIENIKLLKENFNSLTVGQKIVSIFLSIASAALVLAGAIQVVKGVISGNWLSMGVGLLGIGGGIGAAYGTGAYIKSSIPKAAHGGTTKGATVAMVGEGKYNEAIVPLGKSPEFTEMKQDITNAVLAGLSMQGGKSGQPINITINVDKDYIYKSYNEVAKQNGEV